MTTISEFKGVQGLYDEGSLVKALDETGRPVLRKSVLVYESSFITFPNCAFVLKHHTDATPEEHAFWCNEHPGVDSRTWQRVWLQ